MLSVRFKILYEFHVSVGNLTVLLALRSSLYKELLGADEVIPWNSVIRSNTNNAIPDVKEARQKSVQTDAPPAEILKAISSSAHVDQDEVSLFPFRPAQHGPERSNNS